jgi:hypothetical protein
MVILGTGSLSQLNRSKIQTTAAHCDPSVQDGTASALRAGCRKFRVFNDLGMFQDLTKKNKKPKGG